MTTAGNAGGQRVVVLGAGPGGYAAAFHAADLGMQVTLVDSEPNPGGVCLYRGCIPSKALLHVSALLHEAKQAREWGVVFEQPAIDLAALRAWKDSVVRKLTGGLGMLGRQRKVKYLQGRGRFADSHTLRVQLEGELVDVTFDYAIISTGSAPLQPGSLRLDSPRVMDSTTALELESVPDRLLVVGGGYVGLELGSVYASLGSAVTVVEITSGLLPGVDRDLVEPLAKRLATDFQSIMLDTRVTEMAKARGGVRVKLAALDREEEQSFDKVLVAVGRRPNSADLGLESTKVTLDGHGFIVTDAQRRTAEPAIFAVGDVAGEPMLAHKATHEAKVAVQAIAGRPVAFEPAAIPAVVFTNPEIAWCGLTESTARSSGVEITVLRYPWAASGRAATLGRSEGLTKLVIDSQTARVLGVGIVGAGAGDMIAEGTLAVETGARAEDLAATIHAHPTLSETVMEAAELFSGPATHYLGRARRGAG
ncbi:MAG: dihydrolipoyl dehydrogenase [Dehalococcoidia bacterium]|nr:dihydrolipoyl dehydrogenase [Dehalococcoidia bacterium]